MDIILQIEIFGAVMNDYNLNFISNENLYEHVKQTIEMYRFKMDLSEFNKNIIDPIKLTFDSKVYDMQIRELLESEIARQIDKSNNNQIGYFHQNIFKYIGDEWNVPTEGFDVVNETKKIFVEMKNKHNTMNSSSSQKTYMKMQSKLIEDRDATCMLVEVIAKNSQNIKWTISLDGERTSHEQIRRVSIDKFYEIVTGEQNAFKNLCEVLSLVISDVLEELKEINDSIIENTVFEELSAKSDDIYKSLYLLAFERYEGFRDFNYRT